MLILLVPKPAFEKESFRTQSPWSVLQGETEHREYQTDPWSFHPKSNILIPTHISVAKANCMVIPNFKGLEKFTPPIFIRKGEPGILGHNSNVCVCIDKTLSNHFGLITVFFYAHPFWGWTFSFWNTSCINYFSESLWVINSLVFVHKNMIWFYLYYFFKKTYLFGCIGY